MAGAIERVMQKAGLSAAFALDQAEKCDLLAAEMTDEQGRAEWLRMADDWREAASTAPTD